MALPRKRQRIALHLKALDVTQSVAADRLNIDRVRFGNIIKGLAYPSPAELDRIEHFLGGMPAAVYFDAEMLAYRHNWPPRYGDQAGE